MRLRPHRQAPGRHDGDVRHFLDDDVGYVRWILHNPDKFVLNTARKPTSHYAVLHRATCATISGDPAQGRRWTADYAKFCGDHQELDTFVRRELGGAPHPCGLCHPSSI
jgi:hypothetical protein